MGKTSKAAQSKKKRAAEAPAEAPADAPEADAPADVTAAEPAATGTATDAEPPAAAPEAPAETAAEKRPSRAASKKVATARAEAGEAGDKSATLKKAKTGLAPGDDLPEFELETDEGKIVSSADLVKEHGAVIFIYPKANTGGCTTQACGFRDNYDKLLEAGYRVYGLSADKPKAQANWRAKHEMQFNLLCDPSYKALKVLGVAKGDKGVHRSHIIVDKGGKVKQVRVGISPKDSVAEAVNAILGDQA